MSYNTDPPSPPGGVMDPSSFNGGDSSDHIDADDLEMIRSQLDAIENIIGGYMHHFKRIHMSFTQITESIGAIKNASESQGANFKEIDSQLKNMQKVVDKIAHVVSDLNVGEFSASPMQSQETVEGFARIVRKLLLETTRQAFLCRFMGFDFSINRIVVVNLIFALCLIIYLGMFSLAVNMRLNRLEYRLNTLVERAIPKSKSP
jgi:septation ring formation regulator EzrA